METKPVTVDIKQKIDEYESKLTRQRRIQENLCGIASEQSNVNNWVEWSLQPHSVDEIREKCLTDFNNICFSYLCGTSKIPEDFFLELAALSTGLITKDNYEQDIDRLKRVMGSKYGTAEASECDIKWYRALCKKKKASEVKSGKTDVEYFDRIDWSGLSSVNDFSEEFLDKYDKYIVWKNLPLTRRYSKQFFTKHKKEMAEQRGKEEMKIATEINK